MRIQDGDNPLDATSVHPESYEAAQKLLVHLGMTMEDVKEAQKKAAAEKGKASAEAKTTEKKQKKNQFVIRNTNTAMGKALAAAMGGVDAIIFTAGVGENSAGQRPAGRTSRRYLAPRCSRSKVSPVTSSPNSWAMAGMCSRQLVLPETAACTRIAFSKLSMVIISPGRM